MVSASGGSLVRIELPTAHLLFHDCMGIEKKETGKKKTGKSKAMETKQNFSLKTFVSAKADQILTEGS